MRPCTATFGATLLLLLTTPAEAGLFGGGPPSRIPIPAQVFSATAEDHGGVSVALTDVSWDGEVFLFGELGKAQVTVPFERIRQVRFEAGPDDDHRTAIVDLVDGSEPVRLMVGDDDPLYGHTRFGNYKIEAKDLRLLSFR